MSSQTGTVPDFTGSFPVAESLNMSDPKVSVRLLTGISAAVINQMKSRRPSGRTFLSSVSVTFNPQNYRLDCSACTEMLKTKRIPEICASYHKNINENLNFQAWARGVQ